MDSVSRISSGAYATLDRASLANTGSAIRFGSSVCCSRSERNGRPSSSGLAREVGADRRAEREPLGEEVGTYHIPLFFAVRRSRLDDAAKRTAVTAELYAA